MNIVSHRKLKEFYEMSGREDSRVALERWYDIAKKAKLFSKLRTLQL
jgi:mRNA interferase HigB